MITTFDSLNISPQRGKVFLPRHFHPDLKDDIISQEEYKNVKKFWRIMNFENLGELNKIYNFQHTIILCELFKQRSDRLQTRFKYNPRKCNCASSFSGSAQRSQSKWNIALPTDAEHVRVFEKTLIGGFSCVNTRLVFGTKILISN